MAQTALTIADTQRQSRHMVGLLDYFQPRRGLGLLGLPIENQSIGQTPPPGLLGARDDTSLATLNNLPDALG